MLVYQSYVSCWSHYLSQEFLTIFECLLSTRYDSHIMKDIIWVMWLTRGIDFEPPNYSTNSFPFILTSWCCNYSYQVWGNPIAVSSKLVSLSLSFFLLLNNTLNSEMWHIYFVKTRVSCRNIVYRYFRQVLYFNLSGLFRHLILVSIIIKFN